MALADTGPLTLGINEGLSLEDICGGFSVLRCFDGDYIRNSAAGNTGFRFRVRARICANLVLDCFRARFCSWRGASGATASYRVVRDLL